HPQSGGKRPRPPAPQASRRPPHALSLRAWHICPCSLTLRALVQPKVTVKILPRAKIKSEEKLTMYEDKTLVCKDCGKEFVFSAGEQEFYASRGFENEPQRCKECRDARKNATRGTREMFEATCAAC